MKSDFRFSKKYLSLLYSRVSKILPFLVMATLALPLTAYTPEEVTSVNNIKSKNLDGKFVNNTETNVFSVKKLMSMVSNYISEKSPESVPQSDIPIQRISPSQILDANNNTMWRLGHSTILLKLRNKLWLSDPVFSDRASPSQFVGPKRFHENPISIDQLPNIAGVFFSHDHYDHLDKAAVLELNKKVEHFYTPLKLGDLLIQWGIPENKITQLDWWETVSIGEVTLTCTPAQHFSGRGLFDSDKRLWASWVIETPALKLFFSGDSGYFKGFKEIGDRFGPFDVTFMETGAYNKSWDDIHMMPNQSIQAHLDLNGKWIYPIHNGTFDLSLHAWFDPFEKVTNLSKQFNVKLLTPMIGTPINLLKPNSDNLWWKTFKDQ